MKKLIVEIEKKITPELFNVFGCVGFWNDEGQNVYEMNKAGKMGSKFSQSQANKLPYEDFVLESLGHEIIETLQNGETWPKGWKAGKGGSHIWVSSPDNERRIFIHF